MPIWIFPPWPGSRNNGGLCAGAAFKYIYIYIYPSSYHGIPEREQTKSCRGQWHWQGTEQGCWLCDRGSCWERAGDTVLQHHRVPAALQGWFQLCFTPLPYSWVSAHVWCAWKYAGAHVDHQAPILMYPNVPCIGLVWFLRQDNTVCWARWSIREGNGKFGGTLLWVFHESRKCTPQMRRGDGNCGFSWRADGGAGWLWQHPPRWWPGSAHGHGGHR